METEIRSFEGLEISRKLRELHLEANSISRSSPGHELQELGSQIRRSSNSIAAGWNNKHTNICLEGLNRSLAELQETKHHLHIAYRKGYLSERVYEKFLDKYKYDEGGRMFKGLEQS
ncbi:MAG: four helix bundle protein [Candidatus Zixiibacteriota bacterium]